MSDTVIIAIESKDVTDQWSAIQKYAIDSGVKIEWNGEVVIVRGDFLDPEKLVGELTGVIYSAEQKTVSDFHWNAIWKCELLINSSVYRLGIDVDRETPQKVLQSHKTNAAVHLARVMPAFRELATQHAYPVYVKQLGADHPRSRTEFLSTLSVSGPIVYSPALDKYELYFSAKPLFETHLIRVCEENGETYPPALEWA